MKQRDYYKSFYWDEMRLASPSSSTPNSLFHMRKIFIEQLPAAGVILDVGCGRGTNGQFVQLPQQSYLGIDLSFLALRQAREKNLTTALADLEQPLPFPSEEFAGAICMEVLEHLFDPRSLLEESLRILKPRGVLIVSVPNIAHHSHRLRLLGGKFVAGGHPDTPIPRGAILIFAFLVAAPCTIS
jgi:SAM-dependent methyltransferase